MAGCKKRRSGKWQVSWNELNGDRQYETLPTKTLALIRKAEIERAQAENRVGIFRPTPTPFVDAAEQYLVFKKGKAEKTTFRDVSNLFKYHLIPFFQSKLVHRIQLLDLERYFAKRGEAGISQRTKAKERSYLSAFFKHAISLNYCHASPLIGFPSFKYQEAETQYLQEHEWKALREAAKRARPYLRLAIDLGIFAGLRRRELLNLPLSAIKDGVIVVSNTKSKRIRAIPVAPELAETLRLSIPHIRAKTLVHRPNGASLGDIKRSLMNCYARAGIPRKKWGLHVLRHTFGMRMQHLPIRQLQELMGHSRVTTTMRYQHPLPIEELRRLMFGAGA